MRVIEIVLVGIVIGFSISTVVFSLPSGNEKPTVTASATVTAGKAPLKVFFNCSVYDDGKIKGYLWDFDEGSTSIKRNVSHTFYHHGVFNVKITVWDDDNNSASDTINIFVFEYNPPVAIAGVNITYGKAPLTVKFNGSGVDSDGEIVSYYWRFDDGSTSNERNPQHVYERIGTYYPTLIVTDSDGQTGMAQLEINVIGNKIPIANASADKLKGWFPLKVSFKGGGYDPDGRIISYHWNFDDTLIPKKMESNEKNPTHIFWIPGTYLVELTVKDDNGAISKDYIKIEVKKNPIIEIVKNVIVKMLPDILPRIIPKITSRIGG